MEKQQFKLLCDHNRIFCACVKDRSPEQKAFEMGLSHFGYGWTRKNTYTTASEREAYDQGYNSNLETSA